MAGKIRSGLETSKQSWSALGQNRQLIVFSIISGIGMLIVTLLLILGMVVISLLNGAVNGIFQASMYHYAATGDAGPFIDGDLAREAFQS